MIELPSYEDIILILNPPNMKIETKETKIAVDIKVSFDLPTIVIKNVKN